MLIWHGLGFLVVVFTFGAAILCQLVFDAVGGKGYYSSHRWTVGIALLIGAALSWGVGRHLRDRAARVVVDKETGEELIIGRGSHGLFFIPMHIWGPLLAVIGLVLCGSELLR